MGLMSWATTSWVLSSRYRGPDAPRDDMGTWMMVRGVPTRATPPGRRLRTTHMSAFEASLAPQQCAGSTNDLPFALQQLRQVLRTSVSVEYVLASVRLLRKRNGPLCVLLAPLMPRSRKRKNPKAQEPESAVSGVSHGSPKGTMGQGLSLLYRTFTEPHQAQVLLSASHEPGALLSCHPVDTCHGRYVPTTNPSGRTGGNEPGPQRGLPRIGLLVAHAGSKW